MIQKIGRVAYKLKQREVSKSQHMLHVSLLKKKGGNNATPALQLTNLDGKSHLRVEPTAILDRRIIKRRNAAAVQWLIHWCGTTSAEATQEDAEKIEREFPEFQS